MNKFPPTYFVYQNTSQSNPICDQIIAMTRHDVAIWYKEAQRFVTTGLHAFLENDMAF